MSKLWQNEDLIDLGCFSGSIKRGVAIAGDVSHERSPLVRYREIGSGVGELGMEGSEKGLVVRRRRCRKLPDQRQDCRGVLGPYETDGYHLCAGYQERNWPDRFPWQVLRQPETSLR
jgi:hypothetical protein